MERRTNLTDTIKKTFLPKYRDKLACSIGMGITLRSIQSRIAIHVYMLSSKYEFGQSMDYLHKVWILTLSGQSMDCLLN